MALEVESKSEIFWKAAALNAGRSGVPPAEAVALADHLTLAYEARFGKISDSRIGATILLEDALRFFERSALIGMEVLFHTVDSPPVGKIKDFSSANALQTDMVLLEWTSGAPANETERWTELPGLRLICAWDKLK